jgi:2-amino-4-hydroxy-6-hydroxymethyldihydropteridine diphosphokinase
MARVFVGVGSNIDPEGNVPRALKLLKGEVPVLATSTFYRTRAWGRPSDPQFVNGVIELGDSLGPLELKRTLRRVEEAVGRQRQPDRYAPRTIDLDLLLHGDRVESTKELTLPDPEILRRPFIAIPLFELAPSLVLPDSGMAIREAVKLLEPFPMEPMPDFTDHVRKELAHEP